MQISEETFNRLKEITQELKQIKQDHNLNALEFRIEDDAQRLYIRGNNYLDDFHAARFNHKHLEDTTYQEFLKKK